MACGTPRVILRVMQNEGQPAAVGGDGDEDEERREGPGETVG